MRILTRCPTSDRRGVKMTGSELLATIKLHVTSRGLKLVAEDFSQGDEFLPPDQFVVADSEGRLYRVIVDHLGTQ